MRVMVRMKSIEPVKKNQALISYSPVAEIKIRNDKYVSLIIER